MQLARAALFALGCQHRGKAVHYGQRAGVLLAQDATTDREGLFLKSKVDLPKNFYVTGSVLFDLDRYLTQKINNPTADKGPWSVSGTMLGLGYKDECTDFSVTYTRAYNDYLSGTNQRTTTYMMRLVLKDLGDTTFAQRTTR